MSDVRCQMLGRKGVKFGVSSGHTPNHYKLTIVYCMGRVYIDVINNQIIYIDRSDDNICS